MPSAAVASMQRTIQRCPPSRDSMMAPDMVKLEQISTTVLVAPIQNFRCRTAAWTEAPCSYCRTTAAANRPPNSSSSVSSQAHMPICAACFCCSALPNCSWTSMPTGSPVAALAAGIFGRHDRIVVRLEIDGPAVP